MQPSKYHEACLASARIYEGKILNLRRDVVRLPNGRESAREVVEHRGGVGVLPIRGDKVLLVRQFRYPYGEELLEIPAGKREGEEAAEVCGRRELAEETGLEAETLVPLGILYPSPGYTNETIAIFYADRFRAGAQHLDDNEFVDVVELPVAEALKMAVSGRLRDAKTVAALLRWAALRK